MGLASRVKKLPGAVPQCDERITRIAQAGEVLTEADRCRIGGRCHVLMIRRVVVPSKAAGHAARANRVRGEP
jgi:hypothetical protein